MRAWRELLPGDGATIAFCRPSRALNVLRGIARHDDGWAARDATPQITRQGKPSAFSVELVGKYSAFEEIDLEDYLAVRDRAVRLIAAEDPYAAILISMHTHSLLSEHADRSTIAPEQLPLLDRFLERQKEFQQSLRNQVASDSAFAPEHTGESAIFDHFRLLQANDNLSLMTCVDFRQPSHLLHPLALRGGGYSRVQVRSVGTRQFVLDPYPFSESSITFEFPARQIEGKHFSSAGELQQTFAAAPVETLSVTVSAS